MKINFKVIDVRTGEDITDNAIWYLRPDGSLVYNQCGAFKVDVFAKAIISLAE